MLISQTESQSGARAAGGNDRFRSPDVGWDLIVNQNVFIEHVLPGATLRKLTEEEEVDSFQSIPMMRALSSHRILRKLSSCSCAQYSS